MHIRDLFKYKSMICISIGVTMISSMLSSSSLPPLYNYRLALGTSPDVTTPPTCPGHLPICWASSVWYVPATGGLSKWATQRIASPRVIRTCARLEEQNFTFSFFILLRFQSCSAKWNICRVNGQEFVQERVCWWFFFMFRLCLEYFWLTEQTYCLSVSPVPVHWDSNPVQVS